MFATLDDLDAQVELLVFEKVILASEAALQPDQIVLVRGTVDHGENGKVCVKVADVTPFDPSEAEIERARDQAAALAAARAPRPLCLRVDAGRLPGLGDRRAQARSSRTSPASRRSCSRSTRAPACAGCASATEFRVAGRNAALKAELDRVLGAGRAPAGVPAAGLSARRALAGAFARREPLLAQLERGRHVVAVDALALARPGPRARTAGPRSAARTGTPRSPRGRSRRRRGSTWRSRFEPSGVTESLTCSEPSRSSPTTRSNSSSTSAERRPRCGRRSPTRAGGRSRGRRRAARRRPRPRSAARAPRTSARASRPRRRCPRGAAGSPRTPPAPRRSPSPARSIAAVDRRRRP